MAAVPLSARRSRWPTSTFVSLSIFFTALLAVMPFATLNNIPLVDAPNHFALYYIKKHISSSKELSELYELRTGFFPYLGMTLILDALTPIFTLSQASRIFTCFAVLLPPLGAVALSRAIHGRVTAVSLLSFTLTLNMLAGWGFLTYLVGLGAALF